MKRFAAWSVLALMVSSAVTFGESVVDFSYGPMSGTAVQRKIGLPVPPIGLGLDVPNRIIVVIKSRESVDVSAYKVVVEYLDSSGHQKSLSSYVERATSLHDVTVETFDLEYMSVASVSVTALTASASTKKEPNQAN